jgi:hypothetical protein
MSTTPIIIETIMPLGQIQAGQAALRELGPAADVASSGFHNAAAASSELDHEINYVNTQNIRARASFEEAAAGATEFGYSVREARGSARLLSEELGVHLNRELADTLARSSVIGPVLESAFSVFAIVGFIELLDQASKKFDSMIQSWAGWGKEQQQAYQAQLDLNSKILAQSIELRDKEREQNLVGLEGTARKKVLLEDLTAKQKDYATETANAAHSEQGLNKELEHWQALQSIPFVMNQDYLSKQIEDVSASLKRATNSQEEFTKAQQDGRVEIESTKAEIPVEEAKEGRDDTAARIERYKAYADAVEGYDQAIYKARYELGEISLAQETQLIRDSEERKFEAEEQGYQKLRALKLSEGAATGRNVTPDIEKMDSEIEAKRAAHGAKLAEMDATTQLEIRKQAQETAFAQIEADAKVAASKNHLAEIQERLALSHADSPAAVEAAVLPLIKTTTEQYEQQVAALRQRAEILEKEIPEQKRPTADLGTDAFSKQLEPIKAIQPELFKQLTAMNAEVIEAQNAQSAAVVQIKAEEAEKLKSLAKTELDDTVRSFDQEAKEAGAKYPEELSGFQSLLGQKKISMQQYVSDATGLATQVFAHEASLYEQEISAVHNAVDQQVLSEQQGARDIQDIRERETMAAIEMQKRITQAVKEEQDKQKEEIKQVAQTINQDATKAFNSMITGQQKVGQAALKLGQELELYVIDQGIKKVVTTYATELLQMLASHSSFLATMLGIDATGDAAQIAQAKAAQSVIVMAMAGEAGAAAFASTMVALPYPENIMAAPVMMGEAAAETMSAMAFERGGIVPGTSGQPVPITAHAKEMVLPEHISSFIQGAAAGASGAPGAAGAPGGSGGAGGSGGSGGDNYNTTHNHNRFELNIHGGKTDKNDVIGWVKQGIRSGSLP